KKLEQLTNDAKNLRSLIETNEAERTTDNRQKFENMIETGKALKTEIENIETLEQLSEYALEPAGGDDGKPEPINEPGAKSLASKSFGRQVIESAQFKNADRQEGKMQAVMVPNLLKALYNTADAQGGYAVRTDREPDILD